MQPSASNFYAPMPVNSSEITGSTATTPTCLTLVPCSTLEDFPTSLADAEACSLLAAWTTPWHPRLIAAANRLPQWHRADVIPDPLDDQILLVPTPANHDCPAILRQKHKKHAAARSWRVPHATTFCADASELEASDHPACCRATSLWTPATG